MNEQILMGGGLALISCWGLVKADWLLEHSRYGQKFVNWFGRAKGARILQGLMLLGLLFGTLLATNVIQPIRWESRNSTHATGTD